MYARLTDSKRELYQWDTGQKMEVSSDVNRVDFQMKGTEDIMYGCFANGGVVNIPDKLLHKSGVISCYVMTITGGSATRTEQEITVIARDIPPGYVTTKQGDIISYDELTELFANIGVVTTGGATMAGNIDMDNLYRVVNLNDPENDRDAVHKHWMEEHCLQKSGGVMNGRLKGLQIPVDETEPARKKELDDADARLTRLSKCITDNANDIQDILNARKIIRNQYIGKDAFADDTTYVDYGYRAAVAIEGVTAAWIPDVVFPVQNDVQFAPVSESYEGGVFIYADSVPENGVTIPTIIMWRGDSA